MKNTWWFQRFTDYADRTFLVEGDTSYNYAALTERIEAYHAAFTESGLQAGDVVALQGDYTLNGIAALFALFGLKAIVAPITATSPSERTLREEAAQAQWLVQAQQELSIQPIAATSAPHDYVVRLKQTQHPGLILFSSGSTGTPKAMIHDVENLLAPFAHKRARRLCILIFLLYDHIGGLNTLFNGMATGAKIVVPASRDAHVVAQAIETHKVKLLPASPTFLNLFLMSGAAERYDLSSLRFITYGTEPMPESLLKRIKQQLPDTALIQTFGTSETGITQTISRSSESTLIKFDDPNTEYKIVDGELWMRSKSQILGYLNHEMSRFTAEGWFMTGDLVEEAQDGFLKITGRREELINVGGEKVTPSEVESVLLEMPEVADCLVYGEPNAITGHNVAAKIVPHAESDPRKLKRLIKQHCRQQLSPYKVPVRITFVDEAIFGERFKKLRRPTQTN
ncbi:AMP-binding protein [Coraliomargarita sp. SDUM461004]|uniref:AMP-binding protein n=1 Tax=Thalassobacterium sedimentorum TaxID=3041258 RepID=A0ABU1AJ44_9BACT|nr:AMP-binding protein [Coraliomargarita sp. SDUM461004]MDQ8194820.1 AMP-binding protein [Coraliomargarita sp. SDUM461004]